MSERAKGKNHPQDPKQPPVVGSGRNRVAHGYNPIASQWERRVTRELLPIGNPYDQVQPCASPHADPIRFEGAVNETPKREGRND